VTAATTQSYWIASTPKTTYPPLAEDVVTRVVLLGGGITGLTTALLLQKQGVETIVVEAEHIGCGVTGHTTGKLTAGQGLAYSSLEKRHGEETARAYASSQTRALDLVFRLVTELGIDCDLERVANHVFAERDSEIEQLEREAEAAERAGLPVELVDVDVPFPAVRALRLGGQGQFHARKYVLGLAKAYVAAGGRIFERTRATGVEPGRTAATRRVETGAGSVIAENAVLATNAPITGKGAFFARVHPYAAYGIAGQVPEGTLEGMWINVGSPTHSLRTHPLEDGGRLLVVVGEGHRVGQEEDTQARYDALEGYLRESFPGTDVAYRWSTHDQYPVDGLPYVGRVGGDDDGVYIATGFAGWGLTNGTLAGILLADAVLERENEWAAVFDPERSSLVRAPVSMARENASVAKELVGGKLRRRPDSLDAVPPGTGAILALDGDKVAVFRADDGEVFAVSAICTHMGCDVAWNGAERTWDCPCHGSRFRVTGEVLHGPATRPLERVEVAEREPEVVAHSSPRTEDEA
jgi:glycine/D-amino acid oxidase-like deaminating enzyme/nitrite reductase/ring-hydroxylating ferredoxin subunit